MAEFLEETSPVSGTRSRTLSTVSRVNSRTMRRQLAEAEVGNNEMGTVYDDLRRARLQKVVAAQTEWEDPSPLDPHEAMYQLLKHIRLDPDGGILNIVKDTGQACKLRHLKKGPLELWLAVVGWARSVGNPLAMIFFASSLLYRYTFSQEYRDHMHQHCNAIKVPIPLEKLYVICAVTEIVVATFFVSRALYHGLLALCYRDKPISLSDRGTSGKYMPIDGNGQGPRYKYMHVAEFWLRDIPALQSLSALRLLAYAHPNLMAKNAKSFRSNDEVARTMLEKLVGREAASCDEEQLAETLARLTVQHDHKDDDEEQQLAAADELVDLTPYQALMRFSKKNVAKDHEYLTSQGLNPKVLGNLWRLHLITALENIMFGTAVASCAFFGVVEFFTKVCRLSLLLTDPMIAMWNPALFFMFLLNQSMGMISVKELLRWRIETFLFGGSDAIVSAEERYAMNMYLAALVDKIWCSQDLTFWQKLAIMMQLDDDDLQQLVIEEKDRHKGAIAASIRKWCQLHASGSLPRFRDSLARWAIS